MSGRRAFALQLSAVCSSVFWVPTAAAQVGGNAPAVDLRLNLTQLYTVDDATDAHVSFSQVRATFDVATERGNLPLEGHLDARLRRGWTDVTRDRSDVYRAYAQVGRKSDTWHARLGRIQIGEVANALVDGAAVGGSPAEGWSWTAFAGLRPHPITLAVDPAFLGGGGGYRYLRDGVEHAGGLSVQLYEGAPDRIYWSERLYARLGSTTTLFGNAIVDFLAPSGVLGELQGADAGAQSGVERLDLTNGQLGVLWRPVRLLDLRATLSHIHAIVPNRWWQDWIEQERIRLGFLPDDLALPTGTRRSSARLVSNLHLTRAFTPYLSVRYDVRHEDRANGYEARGGLKVADPGLGYLDVGATLRDRFGAGAELFFVQGGTRFLDGRINLDAGATALHQDVGLATDWLYDLNATVWVDLGAFVEPLRGLQIMALYQAFVDPAMVIHYGFGRVAYRFTAG